MTDNYRDEMREALAGLIAGMDAGTFEARCIADDEEELQAKVDATDDLWTNARAALSRLSVQDETAGDAPWNARDTEALRVNAEQKRKIAELEARLSASGQGGGWTSVKDRAPGKRGFYVCAHRSGSISILYYTPLAWLDSDDLERDPTHWMPLPTAPAPEKDEAKRCAWCGGVFASTADGYLTCGKCGKQINPEAYCDPSEIEINTPADDLYKDAPAQPASETCAICSTVPDAADRRMVCAQCVDAFFAGSKPASESAEELADLAEIFGWYDSPAGRDVFEEARKWLASHDAETRNQCADRYCEHKCAWPPREWKHPDECECTERAAILGEGKA